MFVAAKFVVLSKNLFSRGKEKKGKKNVFTLKAKVTQKNCVDFLFFLFSFFFFRFSFSFFFVVQISRNKEKAFVNSIEVIFTFSITNCEKKFLRNSVTHLKH